MVVLDTGFHDDAYGPAWVGEKPGALLDNAEAYDADNDGYVDPAAGHGTFIAGLIDRLAPGTSLEIGRVLSSFGDGDDCVISAFIRNIPDKHVPGILNLSFVGYTPNDEPPPVLAAAIKELQEYGWVVVASAGNDATCRLSWPAALDDVISVGAVGPGGPAWFTNHGPWVKACAPGVDVVSVWFDFSGGDGKDYAGLKRTETRLASDAHGWAAWSGTSFSAPIVAAALARDVMAAGWPPFDRKALHDARYQVLEDENQTLAEQRQKLAALQPEELKGDAGTSAFRIRAKRVQLIDAVDRVINDPRLLRVPNLGTVVNDHL